MATFNLVRNSRLFFTTNVNANTGVITETLSNGFTAANTQELQVLDGFSFSQASNADNIQISEAGSAPVRGQRSFNTSLANVEFSFSTYVRPRLSTTVLAEEACLWNALMGSNGIDVGTGTSTAAYTLTGITAASTTVSAAGLLTIVGTAMSTTGMAVGDILVVKGVTGVGAAQFNTPVRVVTAPTATGFTAQYLVTPTAAVVTASWTASVTLVKSAWVPNAAVTTDTTGPQTAGTGVAYSSLTSALSNRNQLLPFGMIFIIDGVTYLVDNCVMDQAVIDFGLDGIATIAWSGKGTTLRQTAVTITTPTAGTFVGGGVTGTANYNQKNTTANYITNKLSTVILKKNIGGIGTNNFTYSLALTGGSITIANNVNYITPANIGVVNVPALYYTGNRSISGTINAYLRTGNAVGGVSGTNSTGTLLSDLLAAASGSAGIEPKFKMEIDIGGGSNANRLEVDMPGCFLQIPTIDAQAVMSTNINFTAQGTDSVQGATAGYDIEIPNEVTIRYLSA